MPGLFGCGRSYLGFFLRGLLCLRARGGRQGAWLALKNVTMKGCLERGPRRPTRPTDNDRSVKTRFQHFTTRPMTLNVLCCNRSKLCQDTACFSWTWMFVACYSRIPVGCKNQNSFSNFCEIWSKDKTDNIFRSCGKYLTIHLMISLIIVS